MLNPFPIQFLAMLAYTILRVSVGFLLFFFGIRHLRKREIVREGFSLSWFPAPAFATSVLIGVELVAGVMFFLGFYTQIAALITMALCLAMLLFRPFKYSSYVPLRSFYALLLACSVSLFITGAGAFGFDLPI